MPLNCSFEVRGGSLQPVPGRPSKLIGVPYDRPVVGFGGKTINTLRLWAATAPDSFDFKYSATVISSAPLRRLRLRNRSRGCCIRTIRTSFGQGPALYSGIFPGRLFPGRTWCDASGRRTTTGTNCPEKAAIQLNDTHPSMAVPELMRILLDEAHLGWDAGLGP